ncbi:MAG TPA: sugar ABC transporter permease [Trueperaceae bacterium]|nr:sugar ABC transporter permease [Trueperaceae bacterium]
MVDARRTAAASPARARSQGTRVMVPWGFLAPALLLYVVIVIYPSVAGAVYAFTDWRALSTDPSFVGLANLRRLLNDMQASSALKNTLLIALFVPLLQNAFGLVLALGLNTGVKSRYVLRTVFFMPAVVSPLIVSYLWQYIYNPFPDQGLNGLLGAVGLGALRQDWLGNPDLSLASIMATVVWQSMGVSMVIFLAGLQGISREYYEAAELDGATVFARFRHITLPLIAPAITVNLVLSLIAALKLFDQVFAMTNGGPGYATETLSTVLFKQTFLFGRFGYGAMIALVLTAIVTLFAFIQLRVLRSREVEM